MDMDVDVIDRLLGPLPSSSEPTLYPPTPHLPLHRPRHHHLDRYHAFQLSQVQPPLHPGVRTVDEAVRGKGLEWRYLVPRRVFGHRRGVSKGRRRRQHPHVGPPGR